MANATHLRNEQQADLLRQLEKTEAPMTTTSSDSLETLKSNSPLVKNILGLLKNGEVYATLGFQSAPPRKSH